MTKVKTKHVVLSASLALLTALSACAKPGEGGFRAKKEEAAPTAADASPAKAAADMKAEEEAAKKAEAEKAAAVAAGLVEAPTADEAAADAKSKEQLEKEKKTAAEMAAKLFEVDKNADGSVVLPPSVEAALPIPAFEVPKLETAKDETKTEESAKKDETASQSEAPAVAVVDPAVQAAADQAASQAAAQAEQAKLATVKKQYLVSLINPSMLANYTILRQRERLVQLRTVLPELYSLKDTRDFENIKQRYVGNDFATLDQLITHVNSVHLSVVIPLMVAQTGWDMTDLKKNRELMDRMIAELNSANTAPNIRFRQARAKYDSKSVKYASVELVAAYLGVSPAGAMSDEQKQIIDMSKEMFKLGMDAEVQSYFQMAVRKLTAQGTVAKKMGLPYDMKAILD